MNNLCCNCKACILVCSKKAIYSQNDSLGFTKMMINASLCIKCGMCKIVCPFESYYKNLHQDNKFFYYKSNNALNRQLSRSGGFFSSLTDYVFSLNGVVYGVIYENGKIKHERFEKTSKNYKKMFNSKYVQSDLNNSFVNVITDLQEKKYVLFSGSGCQCQALINLLKLKKINYDRLILVDFVCHGVPSQKAFDIYRLNLEKKFNNKISNFNFRDKSLGWDKHIEKVTFINGNEKNLYDNLSWSRIFYSNNYLNESCYSCEFSKVERETDFTIADFWNVNRFDEIKDSELGYSSVIIHSIKGENIFNIFTKNSTYKEICRNDIIQSNLLRPSIKGKNYFKIQKKLKKNNGLQKCLDKEMKYTIKFVIKKIMRSLNSGKN